jgi:hypothetical protein
VYVSGVVPGVPPPVGGGVEEDGEPPPPHAEIHPAITISSNIPTQGPIFCLRFGSANKTSTASTVAAGFHEELVWTTELDVPAVDFRVSVDCTASVPLMLTEVGLKLQVGM